MKKNKLLTIMLIIIVSITLIGVLVLVLTTQLNKEPKPVEASIDDIVLASVDIPEITTNLADGSFARLQLKIQTDSEDAGVELSKRVFQVNNIIIHELSEMTEKDLEGKQGKVLFEKAIKAQINELMQEGEVQHVYITSYIIQ